MNSSGLVSLVINILKGKYEVQIKSYIISLLGDIHPFISEEVAVGNLSEICRILTINIRFNDSNLALAGFSD